MELYWFAPITCGGLGFLLSYLVKKKISMLLDYKRLEDFLLSERVTKAISDGIGQKIAEMTQDTRTVGEVIELYVDKETRRTAIEVGSSKLAELITLELKKSQISNIILEEIKRVLVEKSKLGFLTGLMKGSLWELVEEPMEKAIESYLEERCQPMIKDKLQERMNSMTEMRMYEVGELLLDKHQIITDLTLKVYRKHIVDLASQLLTKLDVKNKVLKPDILKLQICMSGFGVACGLLSMLLAIL